MRVSRLDHCRDAADNVKLVKEFAAWGLTASPSRLSRWEYGNSRASTRLLRAYEVGCGLPPFLLFALNDREARVIAPGFSDFASVDPIELLEPDGIYEILDRALTDVEVSGSDWYQLAAFSASNQYFYLSHINTGIVARRLIEESARSLGAAYILRFEALHLLASQSRMHEGLVEQLLTMFADDSTGAIGDLGSIILRAVPSIRDELVNKLGQSDSPAISVSWEWIADILGDRTSGPDEVVGHAKVLPLAADLGKALPKWAMAHIERDMAVPLIGEALGGGSSSTRHEALLLLMLAGIQEFLSGPILDALESESDPVLRQRLAHLLEYLILTPDPERLEALALAEDDKEIRRSLWASRGHVLEPIMMTPAVSAALADPRSQSAVTYALGISGSIPEDLIDSKTFPAELRGRLAWWHQRGPALLS